MFIAEPYDLKTLRRPVGSFQKGPQSDTYYQFAYRLTIRSGNSYK